MRLRHSIFIWLLVVVSLSGLSAEAQCWSGQAQSARLQSYDNDGTFLLEDGRRLVLAGLERPLSAAAVVGWRTTSSHVLAQPVTLYADNSYAQDRYGRLRAYVVVGDQTLLQARLVEAGWARVYPVKQKQACITVLLDVEAHARARHLGIWSDPAYQLRDAVDTRALLALDGSYQIVAGKVLGFVHKKGRFYLNFGEDWKTDFTVTVAPADTKLFDSPMFDDGETQAAGIIGKRVQVRGFLSRYNGPNMAISSPDQIEILDKQGPDKRVGTSNVDG